MTKEGLINMSLFESRQFENRQFERKNFGARTGTNGLSRIGNPVRRPYMLWERPCSACSPGAKCYKLTYIALSWPPSTSWRKEEKAEGPGLVWHRSYSLDYRTIFEIINWLKTPILKGRTCIPRITYLELAQLGTIDRLLVMTNWRRTYIE